MTDIVVSVPNFDRFLNSGISAWKQEGGDTRHSVTVTSPVGNITNNELQNTSILKPKRDQFKHINHKMAERTIDEPVYKPNESTSNGPRPLKSRPEDRIASIMDNPFYKSFGVRHPRSPRDVPSVSGSAKTCDADGKYGVREDLGDYRPGSGFVHKLMGKFASLGIQEELPVHHIKNASSVEDILDRTDTRAAGAGERRDRGRFLSSSAQHRARSVESLSRRKGSTGLPVVLRHVERSQDRPISVPKSPRDSHIVAPDVKLGRDDIILIENPPLEPATTENEIEKEETSASISGLKDEKSPDELPKPNTVSTVRSLFESGTPLSPTSVHSGDAISADSDSIFTPRDVSTHRDAQLTPRETSLTRQDSNFVYKDNPPTPRESNSTPRDSKFSPWDTVLTPREPILSPRDVKTAPRDTKPNIPQSPRVNVDSSYKPDASKSRFSWNSDLKTAGNIDTPSSTTSSLTSTLASTTAGASTAAEDKSDLSENIKPSSLYQNSAGAETRALASPRSTAAVKAIPASRPSVPARSNRPNSTSLSNSSTTVPPSFTPNIKKTSPVMPVAPFKENKTEEGEENRFLIYSKRSASSSQKETRLRDYSEYNTDTAGNNIKSKTSEDLTMDEKDNVKKSNIVNKSHSKGRAPPIPNQRQEEESRLTPRSTHANEVDTKDVFTPVSPRIENSQPQHVTLVPVEPQKPVKAPRTFFAKSDDNKPDITQSNSVQESKMETEETVEEIKTEETNKPIKGVPSIIANRLKQNAQNQYESVEARPPGELFGVRLGKTRHEEYSTEEENDIPRKKLAPAADKTEKDRTTNLPSEIENEIANVRKRMEHASRNKSPGVSQIFDSSQLQKKRREKQAANSNAAGVPRLDLTSITSEDNSNAGSAGGYRVTPREIKPCNIEFIGGNVSTGRSLLKKNRKVKINIRFHNVLVETFEYPSEETMLEDYMKQHPNEVLVLEEASWPTESSDDSEILDTPRGGGSSLETELLKSNTSLAHSGNLQSYRGKYQQEYELGSVLNQPEKEPEPIVPVEPVDPDALQILPGEEEDNQTWSLDTSSDLLF